MKKVIIVAPYWPSFRDDFTHLFRAKLSDKGIDLRLVVGTPRTTKVINVNKHNEPFTTMCETADLGVGKLSVQWVKGLIVEIRREKPDLVIIHPRVAILNFYLLSVYLSISKIPKVFWDGGFERLDIGGVTQKLKRQLKSLQEYGASAFLTYSSKFAAKRRDQVRKVAVFPAQNTVNVERIASRFELCQPTRNGLRLVYFGAITRDKKIEKLMQAVKILADERHNIHLHIIGSGQHEEELRRYVIELDIQAWCTFEGPKYGQDLWRFVSESNVDLFCLPGIGGLAVNEAMACGLPVVSTLGDGTVGDLISEGINGWLVEYTADEHKIASYFRKYTKLSVKDKMDMRVAARSEILERAPLSGMVDGFLKACEHGLERF